MDLARFPELLARPADLFVAIPRGAPSPVRSWRIPPAWAKSYQVDAHLLEIAGLYPMSALFLVSLISLEDVPGLPPADRLAPEASHELAISLFTLESGPLLPPEVLVQLSGLDDYWLRALTASVVVRALAELPPIVDVRKTWHTVLAAFVARVRGASIYLPSRSEVSTLHG